MKLRKKRQMTIHCEDAKNTKERYFELLLTDDK
ncbi:MAG: hypothetical protein SCABRO_02264 [Candidatus Scalindua brodae]|uniref:Uncharacterized protein n=1 Tax=Candidatus Scalindua brodae TaxID=237368 RepID=A0A0B0EJ06_9BACT|nr:MAG: hypothetical protein SCABRO_02264 [Candidatus Scalindua brodae]